MDRSVNSLEGVELGAVVRTEDRNAGAWQQQQQMQRWRLQIQRLGHALEQGNLGQVRLAFDALVDDVPEPGFMDPMDHPQFTRLGSALQALDLETAREAFTHLRHWPHTHQHRHPDAASSDSQGKDGQEASQGKNSQAKSPDDSQDDGGAAGTLDVTA